MNMTTQSQMGEMPANIVMVDQYAVGETSATQTQMTKTPKKMKISFSMMGQEMNLDSDNPKDLEGQFGAPIKEAMKQRQEFTVDATGQVTAVKTENKKQSGEAGGMGMMMPGMNMAAVAVSAGQPSIFKILPDRAVAKGDTWTDSATVEGNRSKNVYTVKDITANDIVLDYTGESNTKAKQSMMGMTADVATETKSAGTVTLDKTTGLLKQKVITGTTESTISASGQEMNTTTKTNIVITAKALSGL